MVRPGAVLSAVRSNLLIEIPVKIPTAPSGAACVRLAASAAPDGAGRLLLTRTVNRTRLTALKLIFHSVHALKSGLMQSNNTNGSRPSFPTSVLNSAHLSRFSALHLGERYQPLFERDRLMLSLCASEPFRPHRSLEHFLQPEIRRVRDVLI